jgi:hypothetical protein
MRAACAILHGCCTSVLRQLCKNEKKEPELQQVHKAVLQSLHPEQVEVEICRFVSALWRLDPATGVLTLLGTTGCRQLYGGQFDAAFRTLDAITGAQVPPVLVSLDPTTGPGTAIAETDLPTQAEPLAFTADGRLVVASSDGNLYELDPVTGASTLISPIGVEVVSGLSLRVFPRR